MVFWGISKFTEGMNRSDERFQTQRANNLRLYNEYKNMFPDAPASEHEKFIDEIAGDSRYLRNFLPSSEAINSMIEQRDIKRQQDTDRFNMQMTQNKLAVNNSLIAQVEKLSPYTTNPQNLKDQMLGALTPNSPAYNYTSQWLNSNDDIIGSTIAQGQLQFAKKAAETLLPSDMANDASIEKKLKPFFGERKISPVVLDQIKREATRLQRDSRYAKTNPIFESAMTDDVLMKGLVSNDRMEKDAAVEQLRLAYQRVGLTFNDNLQDPNNDLAPILTTAANRWRMNLGNRIAPAEEQAREATKFADQRETIQAEIAKGTSDEAIRALIKEIIPDNNYADLSMEEEAKIVERILRDFKTKAVGTQAKHFDSLVEQVTNGNFRSRDDMEAWFRRRGLEPKSVQNRETVNQAVKYLDQHKTQKKKEWRAGEAGKANSATLAALANPNTENSSFDALKRQYEARGWKFTPEDEDWWRSQVSAYYDQNREKVNANFVETLAKKSWWKEAVATAVDGRLDIAVENVRRELSYLNIPESNKNQLFKHVQTVLEQESGNKMNDAYDAKVASYQKVLGENYDNAEKQRIESIKKRSELAAESWGESKSDILEGDSAFAIQLNTFVADLASRTGYSFEQIVPFLIQAYPKKDDLQVAFLSGKAEQAVIAFNKLNNRPPFDAVSRRTAKIMSDVNMVTLEPQREQEILKDIETETFNLEKFRSGMVRKFHEQATDAAVAEHNNSRDRYSRDLQNTINKLKRYLDRKDRVIGFVDEDNLVQKIRELENLKKEFKEFQHPHEIEQQTLQNNKTGSMALATNETVLEYQGMNREQLFQELTKARQELSAAQRLPANLRTQAQRSVDTRNNPRVDELRTRIRTLNSLLEQSYNQ